MIEKPTILITSVGRTGTEFFAKFFADILPSCTSLHEPDIFKFTGVENKLEHYSQQTRRAGIWRMIFLKALGKWTLVKLSDARFVGKLSLAQATNDLHEQRRGFIAKMPGSVYAESNLGYYGLLDVLPGVFKKHRAIYIVRDGRDWIRSMINWGEVYGKTGVRKLISHRWPIASDIPSDPLAASWHTLSRFEQLCWAWTKLNEFALNSVDKNPHARVFHFENIFTGQDRYQHLNDLVTFTTSLSSIDPGQIGSTDGWLERKIHQSADGFPAWEGWTAAQKQYFKEACGPLMERLNYSID